MALVKWTTPKAVRRYEWQTEHKPILRRLFFFCAGCSVFLCLPLVVWLHFALPSAPHRVVFGVLCAPFLPWLQLCVPLVTWNPDYRVSGKGLHSATSNGDRCLRWHQIRAWSIADHPHLLGIRVLTVKATILRRTRTRCFPFNPRTVDEAQLRRLLCQHVRI